MIKVTQMENEHTVYMKRSAKTQSLMVRGPQTLNDSLAVQLGVSQYVNVCVGSDLLGKGQHHVEVSVTLQRLVLLEGVSVHSRSGIKTFFQFSCSVFEITVS